ncbi:membrane protein insertase YidC [Gilvimarinus algae]|uniref:Membrane protein insertase YidC n=1 Tax=Gilvimarinus algae TaxID=3058037 RepID=A0ABT8TE53_9GAMM|nr:membrane protein insertase YidC [Gilvimarinus sp. SDUM040014]MDO3381668.1 membrane protein insertase YidC [Gilvimarinus sp. SDUM040014]
MDWQKNLLLAAMGAVLIMLVMRWDDFQQNQVPADLPAATTADSSALSTEVPSAAATDVPTTGEPGQTNPAVSGKVIRVFTNTLELSIDTRGGDIVHAALPKHFAHIDTPDEPFVLISNNANHTYTAQSGLIGKNGTDSAEGRAVFTSTADAYTLEEGADTLVVDLTLEQDSATLTKRFTFFRNEYRVKVGYLVDNRGEEPWQATLYGQIKRDSHKPDADVGIGMQPFVGAALTTEDERYKKFSFDDLEDKNFKTQIQGGWVSMVQHYFISAWIPDQSKQNQFFLKQQGNQDLFLMGFTSEALSVAPASQGEISAEFYAGPKDTGELEKIAPYLDLTVDYGWLWWLAKPLFSLLDYIYGLIGNWGLAIIALTIIIKALFFKLSATSYRSMARMRKLAPKMKEIKERHGDDRQKMSQETMKLYRDEKVNPLGGCLPMLIQMPVFLALYWVLMESVELRHTPFLWIPDLSVKDPIFVLPLLMGFTMWLTMRLNPEPPDPMQAKIMQFMPVVFTVMFLWFPAGLVLYWVTNNTLSFLQQMYITRQIEKADAKT